MANAQKRGFRFPWGGDEHPDASDDPDGATGEAFAERLGAMNEDQAERPSDTPKHAAEPAEEDTAVAESAAVATEAGPATPGTKEPANASRPAPAAGWPEHDRRGAERPFAAAPSPAATAPRRAANPLVAGLVKAMREAARTARDESVTTLRSEASAREELIRAGSTANAGELRNLADSDVAGIREWSKAELARVREETERRIAARRDQLVAETQAEARATEVTLQRLADAVAVFEAETDAFFEALLAEEDPARLAGLAERMPQPPTLDDFAASTIAGIGADAAGEPIAAEAEARTDAAPENAPADEARSVEPARTDDSTSETPDHLDPDAAAAAEAESLAGLDGQTQLLVSGLSGMAAIAAFKTGLLHLPGVSAVSVSTTASGEIAFTVTHDGEADLRDGLRELGGFDARILADDGSSVTVAATAVAA